MEPDADPELRELRARVSDLDRRVLELVNERLRVVTEIWRLKAERGYGRDDPGREERMLAELRAANAGPLSEDGVRALQQELLELTRRELR